MHKFIDEKTAKYPKLTEESMQKIHKGKNSNFCTKEISSESIFGTDHQELQSSAKIL